MLRVVAPAFDDLFAPNTLYRAVGVILCRLSDAYYGQLDLFGDVIRLQRLSNLYESVDTLRAKYGKHTVFLGASFLAHTHASTTASGGIYPTGSTTSCRERRRANGWASRCSWARSASGARLEVQHHGLREV